MNNKIWATMSMMMYSLAFIMVLVVSEKSLDSLQSILISLALLVFLGYKIRVKYKQLLSDEPDLSEKIFLEGIGLTKDKLKYYLSLMALTFFAFGVLTWLAHTELVKLESGTADSAMVWAPIAWLYKLAGFWPAVLIMPLLGAWLMRLSLLKMKEEQSK